MLDAENLAAEAELWGSEAERMAELVPPDWRYHRSLRHNVIMHTVDIDELLAHIQPAMTVLELGCGAGWLTLAMAQRGAQATGMDLAEKSLAIGRTYYESIRDEVSGAVTYQQADLNTLELPAETYDVVVVKGTLHHLPHPETLIDQIHNALKSGGLLWVNDTNGDEVLSTVLMAGIFAFILPTEVSYREKILALLRFGLRTPSRVRASIEGEGLSPFEGVGREHDWVELIAGQLSVEKRVNAPAFTGYVTAQLKAPEWLAVPFLKALRVVDRFFVRLGLLHNTGVTLYARKQS